MANKPQGDLEKVLEKVALELQLSVYEEADQYLQAGFETALRRKLLPLLQAGQKIRRTLTDSGLYCFGAEWDEALKAILERP